MHNKVDKSALSQDSVNVHTHTQTHTHTRTHTQAWKDKDLNKLRETIQGYTMIQPKSIDSTTQQVCVCVRVCVCVCA